MQPLYRISDIVRITLPLSMKEGTQINEKFAKYLFFFGGFFGLHRYRYVINRLVYLTQLVLGSILVEPKSSRLESS